jgi:membrane fusion protein
MTDGLFRHEVLEARKAGWLGGISLAQPLKAWALTVVAVTAALSVVMFLVLGTYTRRSRVIGQLVPTQGMATLLAPATGVISRVDVLEGGRVTAGQPVGAVVIPRATVGEGNTVTALDLRLQRRVDGLARAFSAQGALFEAQAHGLDGQLKAAQHELRQVEAEVLTRQAQVRLAQETLQRLESLQVERFVSELQVKQQQSAVLSQVGEVQILQRQATSTRRLIAQLQQAISELPGQRRASESSFQREQAQLEQERVETQARGELVLTAPTEGVVATRLLKPGQAVQVGQPVMTLLPGTGTLEAELLAPSRAIGFIEPGDAVLLRYQAYPYQKFGHHEGRVSAISRSALSPGELGVLLGDVQAGEPYYRITVALSQQTVMAYGRAEPLKPGMVLEADVLGERRRLIEWILEPLYSLRGRIGGHEA